MLVHIRQMLYLNNLAIKVAWEIIHEMIPKSDNNFQHLKHLPKNALI